MKRKFDEMTIHKMRQNPWSDIACLVERQGREVATFPVAELEQKALKCLRREFESLPIGSSIRIMVLVQEREVSND